uniref:Peptidase S1 domain-containing protein n=1 Tax=Calidris pygmaea TaxID=425635 RepID=A0A8C3JJ84_9CHAR
MTRHLLALLLFLIILPPRYGCTEIIGGHVVSPHSWPYMAAIQRKNLTVCGGALVERQWVLTAAHCDWFRIRRTSTNKYVRTLSLPDSYEDTKPGTMCKVAGWGVTSSGKPSKYLQETTLKIVDRKTCQRKYKKYTKITSNMLCALGKKLYSKRDGDSGGPLICADRYSGIVSFGKGKRCGRRDMPGVYTRLTEKYIDWIKKIISLDRDP